MREPTDEELLALADTEDEDLIIDITDDGVTLRQADQAFALWDLLSHDTFGGLR